MQMQRMQQLARMSEQIPDDIARLAHEQQLGTPQASYIVTKLHRHWRWPQYLFPVIFLPFFGGILSLYETVWRKPGYGANRRSQSAIQY